MTVPAQLLREGKLGVVRIDNPPVNALSPALVAALVAAFDAFEADPDLAGLVVECAGRTFVAGGDIAAFDDPAFSAAPINRLLARIEASLKSVAASLFGTVLGGGLELALACHLRVADPATKLSLPEISLGLLPGSLGTKRLPRLIGIKRAAAMISEGKPIGAQGALEAGLIDGVSADPGASARHAAANAISSASPLRRGSLLTPPDTAQAALVIAQLAADAKKRPYLPALAGIAACLEAAVRRPFAEGEAVEAAEFSRLLATPGSRAMRHVFFAERAARRIPGMAADVRAREVRKVGVVGGGTMGAGISIAFANAGFPVTIQQRPPWRGDARPSTRSMRGKSRAGGSIRLRRNAASTSSSRRLRYPISRRLISSSKPYLRIWR